MAGKANKALQKYFDKGVIFRQRANSNGKIGIPITRIITPTFRFGDNIIGIGRGPGKKGDVVGRDPQSGQGNQAGDEHSEGIELQIDLEYVLKFMKEELELPNLKPKENDFEDVEYKYNSLSLTGPKSLIHKKRSLLMALKRLVTSGKIGELHEVPGYTEKIKIITPINSDFRYRQYTEIRKPASNAVIFFARDSSGSMNEYKCDIVSDMAWWIDVWIRSFYKRTERIYVCHDTEAEEVDEEKFYKYRYGGGTKCSSALKYIAEQFKHRFSPSKWNIYIFYFSDGENWDNDNEEFVQVIKDDLPPDIVNFMGITQILCWNYKGSLKQYVDAKIKDGTLDGDCVRTVSIGAEEEQKGYTIGYSPAISEDDRNEQLKKAIKKLLGATTKK